MSDGSIINDCERELREAYTRIQTLEAALVEAQQDVQYWLGRWERTDLSRQSDVRLVHDLRTQLAAREAELATLREAATWLSEDLEEWSNLSAAERRGTPIHPHCSAMLALRKALADIAATAEAHTARVRSAAIDALVEHAASKCPYYIGVDQEGSPIECDRCYQIQRIFEKLPPPTWHDARVREDIARDLRTMAGDCDPTRMEWSRIRSDILLVAAGAIAHGTIGRERIAAALRHLAEERHEKV